MGLASWCAGRGVVTLTQQFSKWGSPEYPWRMCPHHAGWLKWKSGQLGEGGSSRSLEITEQWPEGSLSALVDTEQELY